MIILAIDLGKARTGIAVSDKNEILATPVCTIEERDRNKLLQRILKIIKETNAGLIVVGVPVNMDGSFGESAQNSIEFAQELESLCGIEVTTKDERCTTMSAHRFLNDTNTRGKKRKHVIDSVAATIILQDYLDYKHNKKVFE